MSATTALIKWVVSLSTVFTYTYLIIMERLTENRRRSDSFARLIEPREVNDKCSKILRTSIAYKYKSFHSSSSQNSPDLSLYAIEAQSINDHKTSYWKTRTVKLTKFAKFYRNFTVLYQMIVAIKYLLLCLLDTGFFEEYRLNDCFLVGRLGLDGPATGASKYLYLTVTIFQLCWLLVFTSKKPKISFAILEFLLYDYDEVLEWEARARSKSTKNVYYSNKHYYLHPLLFGTNQDDTSTRMYYQSNLFFKNPFILDADVYQMRPNRTSEVWIKFRNFTIIYFVVTIVMLTLLLPMLVYSLTSVLTTNKGFELSYANCVEYLAEHQQINNNSNYYSFIYNATKSVKQLKYEKYYAPVVLPFDDHKPLNLYHLLRLIADIFDNTNGWSSIYAILTFSTYIIILINMDVSNYFEAVETKLVNLISDFRRAKNFNKFCQDKGERLSEMGAKWKKLHRMGAHEDVSLVQLHNITNTQALVVDFFTMIDQYNVYVSFYISFITALWLGFMSAAFLCVLNPNSITSLARVEIFAFEVFATTYYASTAGLFAAFRMKTQRMYGLISTIMALDASYGATKARWLTMLQYFHPTSLYCFSIINSTEISWLFLLKVSHGSNTIHDHYYHYSGTLFTNFVTPNLTQPNPPLISLSRGSLAPPW